MGIWEVVAKELRLSTTKDSDTRHVLEVALELMKERMQGKLPIVIIDDFHEALNLDKVSARGFIKMSVYLYERGVANFVFLGSDPIYGGIMDLHAPGANSRFETTTFEQRPAQELEEPLASYLSIILAERNDNDRGSIAPSVVLALATDVLRVLGPRYVDVDLMRLCVGKSPVDLTRKVVNLVEVETEKTRRNVGPGTLCRALVESDDGTIRGPSSTRTTSTSARNL